MEDVVDALGLDETGGLFTADSTGAEHRDLWFAAFGFEFFAEVAEPVREFAEGFRIRINGTLEGSDGHFIIVAGIDQNRVRIGDQRVPGIGRDIGADDGVRVCSRHAHGDDFALEAHF